MLELQHLSKTFDVGTIMEHQVFDDFSLSVKKGDFITLIGSNGAGKSTLFNAISGLFYCEKGRILLDGQDVTFMPVHRRAKMIGRLFQDPLTGTAPHMSIAENLALAYLRTAEGASFWGITSKQRSYLRDRLAVLELGLENRLDDRVGLLSGGQRQALTLLMATLVPPKVLLLDEHTAALDPAIAEKVLNLTRSIVEEQQLTCLMITHHIDQALVLGNRTLMMDRGRVVFDLQGEQRSSLTQDQLLKKFKQAVAEGLSDRMLL